MLCTKIHKTLVWATDFESRIGVTFRRSLAAWLSRKKQNSPVNSMPGERSHHGRCASGLQAKHDRVAPQAVVELTWASFSARETSGDTWMYSLDFLCVAGVVAKKLFTACPVTPMRLNFNVKSLYATSATDYLL